MVSAKSGTIFLQMVQEDVDFRPFKLTAFRKQGNHEMMLGVTRVEKPTLWAIDSAAYRLLHGTELIEETVKKED